MAESLAYSSRTVWLWLLGLSLSGRLGWGWGGMDTHLAHLKNNVLVLLKDYLKSPNKPEIFLTFDSVSSLFLCPLVWSVT